jgi:hypothetical protein
VPRTQVLLADVPELVDGLLRQALADLDVDLLPRGATTAELRSADQTSPPPVVILMSNDEEPTDFERELLLPHPEAVVLRVEGDGTLLASRAVDITRRVLPGDFTAETLVRAVETAPNWRQRFE